VELAGFIQVTLLCSLLVYRFRDTCYVFALMIISSIFSVIAGIVSYFVGARLCHIDSTLYLCVFVGFVADIFVSEYTDSVPVV